MGITAGIIGGLGALGSAGASIYGAANGKAPAGNVNIQQPFIPPNRDVSADAAFHGIQGLAGQGVPGQFLPQYQNIVQGLVNNPYAQMFQQGANTAAPLGQTAGMGAYNAGQNFTGAGQSLVPFASQL